MKKIIPALCLFLLTHKLTAQNASVDSLKTILHNTTEPIERFDLLNKITEAIIKKTGYIDSASCMQLNQIAQQLNNDSLLAISYNIIGNYFLMTRDDDITALKYLYDALPLAERAKDKRRISSIYFDMATGYLKLKNLENVAKYARKGGENLPDKSSVEYDFLVCQYESTMAAYYLLTNNPDSALQYGHDLAERSRRTKLSLFYYYSQCINGGAYGLLADNEMAEVYFKKASAFGDSVAGFPKLAGATIYIPFLLNNRKFSEARKQAIELLNLGQQTNKNNLKLAASGFLRAVFDNLQQTDSAYYYSRMESSIKDSIFSQNNINKIQALSFAEQLRTIETHAKQAAAEIQRRKNIQYALLAMSIVTFVILYLLLSRRFITSSKLIRFLGVVALLIVFEFLNLLLHPFLDRITNHSPVLMLLALVCIAALLVPLHHRIEKWAIDKLVEKNKQVRLAAAKKTIEELEGKEQISPKAETPLHNKSIAGSGDGD